MTTKARGLAVVLGSAGWLVLLVAAPAALAAAGGGSGGFGGGGGGGGGGGFSGGGGSYGGGGSGGGSALGFVIFIAIFVLFLAGGALIAWIKRETLRARFAARRARRAERVAAAAAAAAEDDAAFAADTVTREASELFRQIESAWDARDRARLVELVGPDLLEEWTRRLDDFDKKHWHNRVEVLEGPKVDYLGMVNRADDRDDRLVVHVEARLRDYVIDGTGATITHTGSSSRFNDLKEWWTLGKKGDTDHWMLLSIEQDAEGMHQLDEGLVATPEDDVGRIKDETVTELASEDKVAPGFKVAEVADLSFEGTARQAALDLSLADARFAPDVLEVAVRRVVGGWVDAVDGEDGPLAAVASPAAVEQLLYPGDPSKKTRQVVRGLKLEGVSITGLDASAEPPTMTVAVRVRGRRYVEDRDTATIVSGSQSKDVGFTEQWTLALDGPDANPWRIADAGGAVVSA